MIITILFPLSVMSLILVVSSIVISKKNPKASSIYDILGLLILIPLDLILYKNVAGIILASLMFITVMLEIARITKKEK